MKVYFVVDTSDFFLLSSRVSFSIHKLGVSINAKINSMKLCHIWIFKANDAIYYCVFNDLALSGSETGGDFVLIQT